MTDDDFIIIGGASDSSIGRAAIVISDNFKRGHSSPCVTFDNTSLCGDTNDQNFDMNNFDTKNHSTTETTGGNFLVVKMEVWGFEAGGKVRFS